ncbi:amidohydrolase family protein [Agrobacterium leguminum]|uniref:amidohydrolase family protein n=1 Tax=Agrobacterium leguminum TaxID=2792015 RepID=UPI003CE5C5C9
MLTSRRAILTAAAAAIPAAVLARTKKEEKRMFKIATEEAFAIPEWQEAMREVPQEGPEANEVRFLRFVQSVDDWRIGLTNFAHRLSVMDACGVDMHLLSLTTPGVQSFQPDRASEIARIVNDRLAQIIAEHPGRFAGLATVAPQQPIVAARELERAITELGLNGVLINSYTNDEYLDLPKYDPILETAARLGAPLYIHPRTPSPSMVNPYSSYGLIGALWGFAADTGLHAMRLIMSGVFDRHPNLIVVLGHMGEGIPYWFWRIDNMYHKYNDLGATAAIGIKPLKRLPSEYFKTNIYMTTSGMNSHANLDFAIKLLGSERIMFAIDYPYESSEQSVKFLETALISEQERENIAYRTAEKVFRIKRAI